MTTRWAIVIDTDDPPEDPRVFAKELLEAAGYSARCLFSCAIVSHTPDRYEEEEVTDANPE